MTKPFLNLIGIQSINGPSKTSEQVLNIYETFFSRIREIKGANPITRILRYNSVDASGSDFVFIGLEVESIVQIPVGMISWSINNTIWKINENENVHENKIDLYFVQNGSDSAGKCAIFDFSIKDNFNSNTSRFKNFILTANAYTSTEKTIEDSDHVNLVKYDLSWPLRFTQFAGWVKNHLQLPPTSRLEHYGSTAVPGMVAKPVIDILLEVPSFNDARYIINRLNETTWEYWWYGDHMVFVKREKFMGKRSIHMHVAPQDHQIWDGLLFRDYLRTHHDTAIKYANLKQKLANVHKTDRERYTLSKSDFIRSILQKQPKTN
jgi:GrpB-like predicted nucleotidyltransferase (UPF0157 family)